MAAVEVQSPSSEFKMHRVIVCSFVGLACLSLAETACAQGSGSSRTGSTSSGVQQLSSSSGSAGSAAQQLTSIAASATGAAGSRQGTGSSTSGGLSQPQFTQFGQAGANIGNGQFVGRANGQNFVGLQGAGQQSVNAGGQARFSGLGGQGGNNVRGGQAASSQARGYQMRIQQRIAFVAPPRSAAEMHASLLGQFNNNNTANNVASRFPNVTIVPDEAGNVVLRGVVDDDESRKLAEAIARLEPGVRKVSNELQVGSAPLPAP